MVRHMSMALNLGGSFALDCIDVSFTGGLSSWFDELPEAVISDVGDCFSMF